jgi:anti-anti-sigma factor
LLPPQPKERHKQSALAALRSRLHGAEPGDALAPQAMAGLQLRRRRSHGQHLIEVAGTLNGPTRALLVEAVEDAVEDGGEEIVLDLGGLESIDAAGLDAVLTAHLRASDELKLLLVVPGPEKVRRVFANAQVPLLYTSPPAPRAGRARSRGRRASRLRPGSRTGAWS